MTNRSDQVVVGASGQVWAGPTNAVAPTQVTTAMQTVDTDWINLGFISEDGATFSEGKDIADIGAWQSFYPIRRVITARTVAVSFALRQWSKFTVEFALGGLVEVNAAEYLYTPPAPETLSEKSLTLEWADGVKKYRLYIPKGIVSETVETNLTRTAAADLPVTFVATDPGAGVDIYTLFTNDPAFSAASS
jgi:hypothetical protein